MEDGLAFTDEPCAFCDGEKHNFCIRSLRPGVVICVRCVAQIVTFMAGAVDAVGKHLEDNTAPTQEDG